MRPVRTALAVAVATAAVSGLGAAPALAGGILLTPSTPRPGERIHVSVAGCSVGPTPHTATSPAFEHAVTLYGKADTGEGDTRIKKGLAPGRYAVTASCGAGHTERGEVTVVTETRPGVSQPGGATTHPGTDARPPAGHPHSPAHTPVAVINATPASANGAASGHTPYYWLVGGALVVLAGGAGAVTIRRRKAR